MKYIKTFESRKIGKYWLIPTDYRIENAFSFCKVPRNVRENIRMMLLNLELDNKISTFSISNKYQRPKYIYLGQEFKSKEWSWIKADPLYLDEKNNDFENDNFIFKGSVLMDEKDTITNKYNL